MVVPRRPPRPIELRHTPLENVAGILVGVILASAGLLILRDAGLVTGGTAGLALLLSQAFSWSVPVVFALVSLPFLGIAWWQRGWRYAATTLLTILALAGAMAITDLLVPSFTMNQVYAAVLGNTMTGIGALATFRHGSSLGGFGTVAFLAQERLGIKAGYVQGVLDGAVVLVSVTVAPLATVMLSFGGVVVLSSILALNHRPDRYIAS